jgi:ABC-type sugar transport system ATPase subunit
MSIVGRPSFAADESLTDAPAADALATAAVSTGVSFADSDPQPEIDRAHIAAIDTNPTRMLVAQGLTKEFDSGSHHLTVLRDVSFTIPQGTFVAIVGPSGSGKTTLLGLLAGLDTPTRGSVLLDGADLTAMTEDERARLRGQKVGFVFQSFQLIPTLNALENVQVPLELRVGPRSCCSASAWAIVSITCHHNSRVASSSASRSREPSPTGRESCSPTSRPETSTARRVRASSSCSRNSIANRRPRLSS